MTYPNLLRRYVATLIDLAVLWFCIFAATRVPGLADSAWGMFVAAFVLAMLYEPLATVYWCTLGQAIMGIRVRTVAGLRPISPGAAYKRIYVKYILGGISVLTIPAREDRRAIHDIASDTIVIGAARAAGGLAG